MRDVTKELPTRVPIDNIYLLIANESEEFREKKAPFLDCAWRALTNLAFENPAIHILLERSAFEGFRKARR